MRAFVYACVQIRATRKRVGTRARERERELYYTKREERATLQAFSRKNIFSLVPRKLAACARARESKHNSSGAQALGSHHRERDTREANGYFCGQKKRKKHVVCESQSKVENARYCLFVFVRRAVGCSIPHRAVRQATIDELALRFKVACDCISAPFKRNSLMLTLSPCVVDN